MSRGTVVRLAWAGFGVAGWSSGASAQQAPLPETLEPGVLYLTGGSIETAGLPDLLTPPAESFPAVPGNVIQLDGPMTGERAAALQAAGVVLHAYIPSHAYLADLTQTKPADVAALGFVRWVGRWQEAWKLDPSIGLRLAPYQTPERVELEKAGWLNLVVTLFHGVELAQGMNELAAAGAQVLNAEIVAEQGQVEVLYPEAQLALLAMEASVQYVEEAPELTLRNNSNRWIVQSNLTDVYPLYDAGLRGAGQIVGILDGRVTPNHCSFFDDAAFGNDHRKIQAYNTSTGYDQHGTHVAGTAVGDAGTDANTRGVAYLGKLCYNTIPSFSESAIKSRLQTHHNQGARLHTNSWGNDSTTSYDSLCRGIDDFSYTNEDSLVLFAVSNQSTLRNPENAKNLLAVGASSDAPNQHRHCSGGRGPTNDGRRKPEIYAPGCGTVSSSGTACSTASLSGTSMASPAVAGTGLLVRQYYTDGYYPSGSRRSQDGFTPTAALVKATLLNACVDMTGVTGYPSDTEGWGRVLADNALHLSGEDRRLIVTDRRNASGLSTGQTEVSTFEVLGSAESLRVTLVWTEPAASAGANPAYINDLDLEVERPDGTRYRGNYFENGQSAPGGTKDARNNVEQVHVASPVLGTWTVRVIASAVNQGGTQGFALVITGRVSEGGSIGDPTCDDVKKLTARCRDTGAIKGKVRMFNSNFGGQTLRLLIDGSIEVEATLDGDVASFSSCCFDPGDHTVELAFPDGCDALNRTVSCP